MIDVLLAVLIAAPSQVHSDSLSVLRNTLGDSIEVRSSPAELRYCPDDTCEAFQATDPEVRADFALLYLHEVSPYVYLESWRKRVSLSAVHDVIDRYRDQCEAGYSFSVAACVLSHMRERYSIRVFHLRYDESAAAREPAEAHD